MARVVVAEDNQQLLSQLGAALKKGTHTVRLCDTGKEALRVIQSGWADLLVTDLHMPGEISGIQLIEAIKAAPNTAHIPVIVVTVTDHTDLSRLGAARILTKPVSPADLLRHVDAAVPAHLRHGMATEPGS